MNQSARISFLYNRYISAEISEDEARELFALAELPENEPVFYKLFSESWEELEETELAIRMAEPATRVLPTVGILRKLVRWKYAAAAVVLLLLSTVAYYWFKPVSVSEKPVVAVIENKVTPGSDKAILTLSNGRKIELGNNKEIINDGSVKISSNGSELSYEKNSKLISEKADVVALNTMTTPRGGQYKLTLPDGYKSLAQCCIFNYLSNCF